MQCLLHDLFATILTILDLLGSFKSGNSPGVDGKAHIKKVTGMTPTAFRRKEK